ncbi:MAG TPA: ATP-binding protein [Terriglobia bacterium]|nr:ATP-binding protein [Terriglobia bacterium]
MRIVISSQPKLLNILRCVVRYRAQEVGFPETDVDWLTMAIDEAATNVMRHAYQNRRDGKVKLEIQAFPDRMEFILEDSAPKVSPEKVRPRSLDDVRPGGLGTFFIHSFMDSCHFDECFAGGNRLIMVKNLPRKVSGKDESTNQKS